MNLSDLKRLMQRRRRQAVVGRDKLGNVQIDFGRRVRRIMLTRDKAVTLAKLILHYAGVAKVEITP